MYMTDEERFRGVLKYFGEPFCSMLFSVDPEIRKTACEIRLRAGCPLSITVPSGQLFLCRDGCVCTRPAESMPKATPDDVEQCFRRLCGYSVHTHKDEFSAGYIPLYGGNRAGICSCAVYENGRLTGAKEITSVNLRIARQVPGAADGLMSLFSSKAAGILIAGAPGSGKTTVLRDLARQLSVGGAGNPYKVSIADSRGEIAAVSSREPQNDIGLCDVLTGYPADAAVMTATRYMSPDIIVCDEIGSRTEAEAISDTLNAGVAVIASVHASNAAELIKRRHITNLIETGAFDYIVFLKGANAPSEISRILKGGELLDTRCGNNGGGVVRSIGRDNDLYENEGPCLRAVIHGAAHTDDTQ